jgi:DNA-binding protein HU-beta
MTKAELISEISKISGLTKADSEKALDACIKSVEEALKNGEEVKLVGFGTFSVSERKATIGRNPKTNEPINIAARYVPKFKPGKQFKDIVEKRKGH